MKKISTLLSVCLIAAGILPGNLLAQTSCPENLLHFWKFEQNSSGKFLDQTGSLDATIATTPDISAGKIGSSAFFNGNAQVSIPDDADFDWAKDANFTFEFWVKKTTACPNQNTSSNNVIIGRDDAVTQLHWWIGISCTNPGKVSLTLVSNDGTNQTLETKHGVIDGNWHLIGVVRDGTTGNTSIFIDGVADTTANYTFTDNFGSIAPITVGWLNAGLNYHFEGYLDELAFYNKALQAADFEQHYNSGAGQVYCQTEPEPVDSGPYSLTVNFTGMNSVVGKLFSLYVINHNTSERLDSVSVTLDSADFAVIFDSLRADSSYNFDIWSDKNENGKYNVPPVDEAWRIELLQITSDTVLDFAYNTDYTNIFNVTDTDSLHYNLTIQFTGFEPEMDRDLTVYVRNPDDGSLMDSVHLNPVSSADFTVDFDSLNIDTPYNIDLFTDLNGDSVYSAPPTDHAWRIELPGVLNDTVINFAYDTNYVDIFPVDTIADSTYVITLNFTGFTGNVGQKFVVFLRNPDTQVFVDSLTVNSVDTGDFTLVLDSVAVNSNYNIDFYADVNANGKYDAPPVDNSWRIQLVNVLADTTIAVAYDTNYVDIGLQQTGSSTIEDRTGLNIYPNPAGDFLKLQFEKGGLSMSVFNLNGALVLQKYLSPSENNVTMDISALKPGVYIIRLNHTLGAREARFVKR